MNILMVFLWFSFLCLTQTEDKIKKNEKIVGGYVPLVKSGLEKYIVSIRWKHEDLYGQAHICAGSVLSQVSVLTAAHCLLISGRRLVDRSMLRIVAGSTQRFKRESEARFYSIAALIIHQDFNRGVLINDIAIIRTRPMELIPNICEPVKLALAAPPKNSEVIVLGWGRMWENGPAANELVHVRLILFSDIYCDTLLNNFQEETTFCAGTYDGSTSDSCVGDSGGPLFYNDTIAGIVSYGLGCGHPYIPGVYTNVSAFHSWILRNNSQRNSIPFEFSSLVLLVAFRLFLK